MTEERTETSPNERQDSDSTRDKPGSLWILWAFMALLAAYPLSIGPVAKYYQYKSPSKAVTVLYEPIRAVHMRSKIAADVIDSYIHLWGVN